MMEMQIGHIGHLAAWIAIGLSLFVSMSFASPAFAAQRAERSSSESAGPLPRVNDGTMKTDDWTLIEGFSDEFDGSAIDTDKWATQPVSWGDGWSWRAVNSRICDGKLRIDMKYEPHSSDDEIVSYTSGIVMSKAPILYGYFEARVKGSLPMPGTIAAFWLGGHRFLHDPLLWTEIDIFESRRIRDRPDVDRVDHIVHVFKHPNVPESPERQHWAHNVGGGASAWNPAEDYHVYGCEWTPRVIRMYVDGKLRGVIANRWWHQPLYLILSLGLREPYRSHPTAEGFPSNMGVDYVRVWKSSNEALPPLMPESKVLHRKQWEAGLEIEQKS